MHLPNLGERFYRVPDSLESRMIDVYKIISISDADSFKVIHTNNETNTAKFELVPRTILEQENMKLAPWHYKIKIQFVQLVDGNNDIVISLFDNGVLSIPIYQTSVLRGITKKFPLYILATMTSKYEKYREVLDSLNNDILYINYEYSFVGYIDDSLDNILSMISLDQKTLNGIYDLLIKTSPNELLGTKTEVIKNFLEEYCKFSDCFGRLFGIHKMPFKLTGKSELNAGDRFIVEALVQDTLIDYIIVQYYIDIDIDRIKNNFTFLKDADGKLFILNYHGKESLPGIV